MEPQLPHIIVTNRDLRDLTDEALAAIRAANSPPSLFQRGGLMVRVRVDGQTTPRVEPLSPAALRGVLARTADWRRITRYGEEAIPPPLEVVHDIQTLDSWPDIPELNALIESPTFASDGELLSRPGYHPAAQLWLHYAPGFAVPEVKPEPSAAQIRAARDLLLVELLGDFPSDGEASRAHALAALLLPFTRELITGPTPLHLIDAPAPGTGKGLLADAISIPATGRGAEVMAEGQDDEEWRKRITARLLRAPVVILVDNVCRRIDSAALAAVLTTTVWTDRILGKTATVTVPIRAIWLATGNNVTVSNEIARRSPWMRLDARTDMPWQRCGFRHSDLRSWAHKNRGRLVHAAVTLVQAWLAAGRPPGEATLGSFETWASTTGGILNVAEVPGFLSNAEQLYIQADAENQEWRAFVARWWDTHADERVGTDQLYDIADNLVYQEGLLAEVLGDGSERSKRTRLGKALGRLRDRIFTGFRIIDEGEDRRGRRRYRLERVGDALTSRRRSPGRTGSTSAGEIDDLTDF